MIVAIQAGDKDQDPAQTRSHMERLLREHTSEGDSLLHVEQPSTMMDQVHPVAEELGLDVTSITCNYRLHGADALAYAWGQLVTKADKFLLLRGSEILSTMDREFLSYVELCGYRYNSDVVHYERIVVL